MKMNVELQNMTKHTYTHTHISSFLCMKLYSFLYILQGDNYIWWLLASKSLKTPGLEDFKKLKTEILNVREIQIRQGLT